MLFDVKPKLENKGVLTDSQFSQLKQQSAGFSQETEDIGFATDKQFAQLKNHLAQAPIGYAARGDLQGLARETKSILQESLTPGNAAMNFGPSALAGITRQVGKKGLQRLASGGVKESPLLQEARKYKSAEEFVSKMQGSATQYGDYTPNVRLAGLEGYENITKLGVKPDEIITIYRGIDDIKGNLPRKINDGDFVTTDFDSALSYAGSKEDVVSMKVKAKDLYVSEPKDFKAEPFYTGSEYVYTTKGGSPLSKSQLTDIWNKANKKKTPEQVEAFGFFGFGNDDLFPGQIKELGNWTQEQFANIGEFFSNKETIIQNELQVVDEEASDYDLKNGWRAKDPKHVANVTSIHDKLQNTPESIQADIDRRVYLHRMDDYEEPKTSGKEIYDVAIEYGVEPRLLAAIIANDSQYGMTPVKGTFNLSNIGTYDGKKTAFDDWGSSLRRTADFLASIKITY